MITTNISTLNYLYIPIHNNYQLFNAIMISEIEHNEAALLIFQPIPLAVPVV